MRRRISISPLLVVALSLVAPLSAAVSVEGRLAFGRVSGEPGELVSVPITTDFDAPIQGLFACFQFDADRLEFLRYDVTGSEAEGVDPLSVGFRTFGPGDGVFLIYMSRTGHRDFRIPEGQGVPIGQLVFRIRADAEAGGTPVSPVVKVPGPGGSTLFELDRLDAPGVRPAEMAAGTVTVLPPSGPRPVSALACAQLLDRVELSFEPTEAYDSIEVLRRGELVSTLSGDATGWIDPISGRGTVEYGVVAVRDGDRSLPAPCEVLVVSPSAPAVEDLTCDGDRIEWTNPVPLDAVVVLRDGEEIARLPGDATSYLDGERPDRMTLYTVIAELEGFRSPEIHCVAGGTWILEVGDVHVPVDAELFFVPVFGTTSTTTHNFDTHVDIDQTAFEYIQDVEIALVGTQTHPEPEIFRMGVGARGVPSVGMIYDALPPVQPEKLLRSGLRQLIINLPFRPRRPLVDGEVFPVTPLTGTFGVDPGTGVRSQKPDLLLAGNVYVGSAGPDGIRDLEAVVAAPEGAGAGGAKGEAADIVLTWTGRRAYDAVRIQRNGETIAELAGDAREFVDGGVSQGLFTYKVAGMVGGHSSLPASAFVSTFSPAGAFLRGDANGDDRVNLGDAVSTLEFLFRGGEGPSCEDAADADDDGRLALTDAVITLHFLFLGDRVLPAPGVRYPWYDPTPDALACGR